MKNMTKKEYNKLFMEAIKKSDEAIIGKIEIDSEEINTPEDYDVPMKLEECGIYFRYKYSIDDRVERMDETVVESMNKILGKKYGTCKCVAPYLSR
jgi:hypothetical protein